MRSEAKLGKGTHLSHGAPAIFDPIIFSLAQKTKTNFYRVKKGTRTYEGFSKERVDMHAANIYYMHGYTDIARHPLFSPLHLQGTNNSP